MSHVRLLNPTTGSYSFGRVPRISRKDFKLAGGEIYLPKGKHIGPHRGFGAAHIWAEHQKEMAVLNLLTEEDVPAYVAKIVCVGTTLLYEGTSMSKVRLMAVRNISGTAILEARGPQEEPFWSVVTAFSANKKHGVQVGTVLNATV